MGKEQLFFLQILADYMNKRPTQVPDGMDWSVLKEIGRAQQLTGVIYHQCKNSVIQSGLPTTEKNKWKATYVYDSFIYSKRMALLNQIDAEFQKENIPYLIFKGTEIAKYYPVPAQRTMGDIDLLVHEEDKHRAGEAFIKLGFELDTHLPVEWFASKDEMIIELHHRLIYDYHSVELQSLQSWGDKVWKFAFEEKGGVKRRLDLTYHLVFVLLHLRKHFLLSGVGFRQFLDLAILASRPEINWQQAASWLKELKLERFSQVCFAFCRRWFCVKIPISEIELQEDFYHDATDRIIQGGVFGLPDKEYKENIVFNEVRYAKSSRTYSLLKRAFLPYSVMRNISYCKFLDGRPYLLPVAWGWRLVYRMGQVIPLLKGAYSSEIIKKKEDMLTKWGL